MMAIIQICREITILTIVDIESIKDAIAIEDIDSLIAQARILHIETVYDIFTRDDIVTVIDIL